MNIPAPWKKPLFFGLFGAIGCLAGWLIGEPLLAMALPSGSTGGRAPSLIARAQPPAAEAPPLPAEFRNRAALANAKTGDLQFSLIWDHYH